MIYGSVCSGIEAASVAWEPLGWKPAFFSEIDRFACAVLDHRFPGVPLHGDFRTIERGQFADVDVLVGGTPCQDFSNAGLRAGLAGDRGALTIEFLHLAQRLRPRWLVWENVPGVLSVDEGEAFGTFLGLLAELGYGFAYRVLDAQYFGVPQRRRRVFVVGHFGDWRRAAAVLFERESLSRNSPPSRKAGPGASLIAGDGAGSGIAQSLTNGLASGGPDAQHAQAGWLVAGTILAATSRSRGAGTPVPMLVFDTKNITSAQNRAHPKAGDPSHPLAAGSHAPAIAFSCKDGGGDAGSVAPTLPAMPCEASHANGGGQVAVAFYPNMGADARSDGASVDMAGTLAGGDGGNRQSVATTSAVRRLTPRECERLQGFADDFTLVPYRKKLAADGPRYRALGNSMAVPVMRWLGERIAMVDEL